MDYRPALSTFGIEDLKLSADPFDAIGVMVGTPTRADTVNAWLVALLVKMCGKLL